MASSLIIIFAAVLASSIPASQAFVSFPNLSAIAPGWKTPSLVPKCTYENKTANCCSTLPPLNQDLCATFEINVNKLSVNASLSFNNRVLAQRKVEVGKVCVPVGGMTPVTVCLQFYWVEIGLGDGPQDITSNVCFQGSVSRIASVDFQCLRFENGKFSRNADHQPSSKGWINFDLGK